jgi:hypothetical protein
MKNPDRKSDDHPAAREGDCHRCGWTQPLTKITRQQRAEFSGNHSYRWLCAECVVDLQAAPEPSLSVTKATLQNVRTGSRSVA